ncbi:MAG TPA: 1-(5-phosphoribosyl)-5-[(5-phosphoribosylamino)methylideneamino]imidazole-4-carboxamide isomerase [Hadesarchaea archaeon]|nr:1-(5-phosphoribosyl)-5-[(5-phosphoribosylamino)methylideneamino]imidazole-4-carboxamide isomerase [Hadesarchaea archaeon]
MLVVPSVDIMRGRCVQLVGGKPETERVYGEPVEIAQRWVAGGASYLHVVDLDAAMGTGDNFQKVAELISNVGARVEVGGGVRTLERANELFGAGADRVILGTAAVKNPELVKKLVKTAGGARVMVALDSRSDKVTIDGWRSRTEKTAARLAKEFERIGVGSLLYTRVDVEGSMRGVAAREIKKLVESVGIPVFASGGVGTLDDIRAVKETGAAGLVVGMGLYERKFTLRRAMEVAEG